MRAGAVARSGNRQTRLRTWNYLYSHGPMKPRELVAVIYRTKWGVYQALQWLMKAGKVRRVPGNCKWHVRFEVVPGSTPPDDGRGMHPNSRAALARIAEEKDRGLKRGSMFRKPCALAECYGLLPLSRGGNAD